MRIVSLTTDFGLQDFYVAELKGNILSQVQDITLVDVSHQVDAFDIVQAAYFIENVVQDFPSGSIHIAAVYNYYNSDCRYIVLEYKNQFLIGPDNGIFSLLCADMADMDVYQIDTSLLEDVSLEKIYAYAVAHIVQQKPISTIGKKLDDPTVKMAIKPVISGTQIRATIIHIDHYENVVVNLKRNHFERLRNWRDFEIYFNQTDPITSISMNYGDVAIGEVLCLFNSAEYLEIAINMGQAATMLDLHKNETIQIHFIDR